MRIKTKIQRLKQLVPKKNALVFKSILLNPKVLSSHKVLPFFLITNDDSTLIKKASEVIKVFWKLKQQSTLAKNTFPVLPKAHAQYELPCSEYLLSARIDFFTSKVTLVGSRCWLWFFDIYENSNSTVESQVLDPTFSDNISLSARQIKKKWPKRSIS